MVYKSLQEDTYYCQQQPGCYVGFEILHNFCERQKQNGRHLFKNKCHFVHFTRLCIEIMDIKQN